MEFTVDSILFSIESDVMLAHSGCPVSTPLNTPLNLSLFNCSHPLLHHYHSMIGSDQLMNVLFGMLEWVDVDYA